jgi:hypothetical protein
VTERENQDSLKESLIQEVSKLQISRSAEVRVKLARKNTHASIILNLYQCGPDGEFKPTGQRIEIPAALFPELRRAVEALGAVLTTQRLSGDFEEAEEESKEERKVIFAHPSEEEFAKILDFYQIKWQYEPRTFAISWDSEGKVLESFTPDVYLPDYDLYIELTTLKQELVTRKNRKVRRLKQLYPEINVRVMYAKDYQRLLEKFAAGVRPEELGENGEEKKDAPSDL